LPIVYSIIRGRTYDFRPQEPADGQPSQEGSVLGDGSCRRGRGAGHDRLPDGCHEAVLIAGDQLLDRDHAVDRQDFRNEISPFGDLVRGEFSRVLLQRVEDGPVQVVDVGVRHTSSSSHLRQRNFVGARLERW